MREMTNDEWSEFLNTGTRTGKLALVLPSGRPTVTPVWFLFEDGVVRFETGAGSAKVAALRADPRASIVVDMEEPPYAFVRVDGEIDFDDDPVEVLRVARAVGGRYMGPDRADEFAERNGGPGQIVLNLRPAKVTAFTDLAD